MESDGAVSSAAEMVLGARGDMERQKTSLQALERARRAVPPGDDEEGHDLLEAGVKPGRALVFA
jgi:hypothetical protein